MNRVVARPLFVGSACPPGSASEVAGSGPHARRRLWGWRLDGLAVAGSLGLKLKVGKREAAEVAWRSPDGFRPRRARTADE